MCRDDGGRKDAHLVVRPQHVEVVDPVAEAVLVTVDLGRRRDREVKGPARLVDVADRLHAHLSHRLLHDLGVGEPAFVLDFEDQGFAALSKRFSEGSNAAATLGSLARTASGGRLGIRAGLPS